MCDSLCHWAQRQSDLNICYTKNPAGLEIPGGGVGYKLDPSIGVRVIQAQYLYRSS